MAQRLTILRSLTDAIGTGPQVRATKRVYKKGIPHDHRLKLVIYFVSLHAMWNVYIFYCWWRTLHTQQKIIFLLRKKFLI
jgi:hypothetical protein